jgi:hypothetical protein
VLGVKDDLDALACLLPQSREHLLARLPEDLDPDRRVERSHEEDGREVAPDGQTRVKTDDI